MSGLEVHGYHVKISPVVLHALRLICLADMKRIFNFRVSDEIQYILNDISERYIRLHLSREFKSLDFYYEICDVTAT